MDIADQSPSRRIESHCRATKATITQAQLAEMMEMRDLARRADALRREIVALLDAGAEIEPGPLTAWVHRQDQQRLTAEKLAELVGADQVATWKRQVPATVTKVLRIETCES